jgi:hypothetical protein
MTVTRKVLTGKMWPHLARYGELGVPVSEQSPSQMAAHGPLVLKIWEFSICFLP